MSGPRHPVPSSCHRQAVLHPLTIRCPPATSSPPAARVLWLRSLLPQTTQLARPPAKTDVAPLATAASGPKLLAIVTVLRPPRAAWASAAAGHRETRGTPVPHPRWQRCRPRCCPQRGAGPAAVHTAYPHLCIHRRRLARATGPGHPAPPLPGEHSTLKCLSRRPCRRSCVLLP